MAIKDGIYNSALDSITQIIEQVSDSIADEFKKTRPFDKQPVSNEELILNYQKITPEIEQAMRQAMGNLAVDNYKMKIQKLMSRRGLNA